VGGVAVAVALVGASAASAASAATLIGDYQFQGTLASSGTGPALTHVGSGTSEFQNDNVMGSSRQVLAFALASGVQISPAGVGTGSYSVVTTFRFDDVASYERILDQTIGTEDSGLYVDGDPTAPGHAYLFYDRSTPFMVWTSETDVFANNVYATTAVVVTPPSQTKVYVNGTLQFTPTDGRTPINDTLRLFKDDGTEESAGAVSCIRLYSGGLSPAEVAGIGASPTCGTVASSTPTPTGTPVKKKKCKKHKKKHKRSADSAKKKKKKCKKSKKKR
jgi:hypothetical protein